VVGLVVVITVIEELVTIAGALVVLGMVVVVPADSAPQATSNTHKTIGMVRSRGRNPFDRLTGPCREARALTV
jgi:hypothetical protein